MTSGANPAIFPFIITLAQMALIGLGIIIARILQQTDVPKLATIILIVISASMLGMMGVIAGEAVIALLSGIAGYVLGNRTPPKDSAPD